MYMGTISITGDCHGDYIKFSRSNFPFQKRMTKDDVIIVTGDFGIWDDTKEERYRLDELSRRSFTTLFVDGNHSNFDRLCTEAYKKYMRGEPYTEANQGEFPLVDLYGGKAQKIRDGVYHLLRGEIYEIHGKKILAFGGAASHDIRDGILDRANYNSDDEFEMAAYFWRKTKMMYRINHISWWKEELPNEDEKKHAWEQLKKHDFKVDYIVTHCAPTSIHTLMGADAPNDATNFLQEVANNTQFEKWFFGHYHDDRNINMEFSLVYKKIISVFDSERFHFAMFNDTDEHDDAHR
jgi:hypothetical protein